MFSGEFIERGSDSRKPFAHLFCVAADSHAEMFRSVKKAPGDDACLIFFQQELAKSVSMAAGKLRECDTPRFGPYRKQIFSRAEKIL